MAKDLMWIFCQFQQPWPSTWYVGAYGLGGVKSYTCTCLDMPLQGIDVVAHRVAMGTKRTALRGVSCWVECSIFTALTDNANIQIFCALRWGGQSWWCLVTSLWKFCLKIGLNREVLSSHFIGDDNLAEHWANM